MNEYTNLERGIARFLSSSPILKRILKRSYTILMRLMALNQNTLISKCKIKSIYSIKESFFGYYDKSPSNGESLIIFHSSDFDTSKTPEFADYIDINVQDEETGEIIWTTKSKAFNWQQGSRLQWLTPEKFIYNDFDQLRMIYVAKVVNVNDFSITEFSRPVQDSYKDEYFLSLNYRRLRALRPDYGYFCMEDMTLDELNNISEDGVWKIDFATGRDSLLFSLLDIYNFETKIEFAQSTHKVNHFQINPSGNSFVFLHRYLFNGKRFDRLLLADLQTESIKSLSDSFLVSHYHWLDNNNLIVYLDDTGNGECYIVLNIKTDNKTPIDELKKYGDGHPSGFGSIMVTDTYPNRTGMQSLLLIKDIKKDKVPVLLGEFYHPLKFHGISRCDLHPRLVPTEKVVYIDSVFSGSRQLYKLEIDL